MFAHYAFFGSHSEAIGTALLLMFLYGLSAIPFSYLVSFLFQKGNTGYSFVLGFCSIVGVGLCTILKAFQNDITVRDKINKALWAFRIFPTFSLASGFSNLYGTAFDNALCESIPADQLQMYCQLTPTGQKRVLDKCCTNLCKDDCLKYVYPITWEPNTCGYDVFFLSIDAIIYISLLLMLETKIMAAMWDVIKLQFQKSKKTDIQQIVQENTIEDSDVLAEETRIKNLTEAHPGSAGEALVVSDLTKVFKNFYAVNHLTFGIHQEECFGLLGVNGAGKTTTFRMLTGDCKPDKGNALIHSDSLRTNLRKFQSYLGYCPQFDALIDRLTGREMLELFAQLRGLTGPNLQERVNKMIKMTDLTKHADKQTQFYSGGNKRKLSVAMALIGCPPLILLDEPTAGVDPVSRRKIWNILSQARNNTGAAVLLTTHSMEESEALCNRLAIMVNGRFQCLGSIQQLKSKYGQGYTLIIKMKREDQNEPVRMNAIKAHIQSHLMGANLKDDHQGMLQYHIVNPQITLSYLFKFMSSMKIQFELEDYLISDTSLEQIFLAFARTQRETT
ncbi:ATP-binding cassette sub-family A member 17 [Caerostris darwini]|uniref:ATP-binding cassette sub-family A member 17 n=1 Tax=Caerostris darwini TaxID=1538125 RepID=A0AAV4VGH1_9ARAC|nr:ATP-binding cassette sub-family A member 17 [Caerostris darwini]